MALNKADPRSPSGPRGFASVALFVYFHSSTRPLVCAWNVAWLVWHVWWVFSFRRAWFFL